MKMVFCRGCGKNIHDTAPACPHCGAPQLPAEAPAAARNLAKLVGWAAVWTLVLWFGALFVAGLIAGVLHPTDASAAGQRIGEALGGIFFVVAVCISGGLTFAGALPGTAKPKSPPRHP